MKEARMPDQAPPAPDGCVYGPWWDQDRDNADDGTWLALIEDDGDIGVVCWDDGWGQPEFGLQQCATNLEVLRLAQENDRLKKALGGQP